jgi:GrpB-like predicted nucleotidyltransferase (UPF0157 family)
MLAFRDRRRASVVDFEMYREGKIMRASRSWVPVQDYADAKSPVVEAIIERAIGR